MKPPSTANILHLTTAVCLTVLTIVTCLFAYQSWCGLYIEEANAPRVEQRRGP